MTSGSVAFIWIDLWILILSSFLIATMKPEETFKPGHSFQVIVNRTDVCSRRSRDRPRKVSDNPSQRPGRSKQDSETATQGVLDPIINRYSYSSISNQKKNRRRTNRKNSNRRNVPSENSRRRQRKTRKARKSRRSTDTDAVEAPSNHCLPPSHFGAMDVIANKDGSETKIECCYPRGHEDSKGYLQLCATCIATTTLPSDFYPRQVHEHLCLGAIANTPDNEGCLHHSDVWHGKCSQRTIYHNVLKRNRPDGCRIRVRRRGKVQPVQVEDWTLDTFPIRDGCECKMNKLSMFHGLLN
ncbi:uncharacterized protein LOC135489617 [Lineus longissimus]|uniref:uncharacterized protein LOC135489617 n=1 Tax=Lineus longissimus TaxID=88925 RepID=UPI002B4DF0A2